MYVHVYTWLSHAQFNTHTQYTGISLPYVQLGRDKAVILGVIHKVWKKVSSVLGALIRGTQCLW